MDEDREVTPFIPEEGASEASKAFGISLELSEHLRRLRTTRQYKQMAKEAANERQDGV